MPYIGYMDIGQRIRGLRSAQEMTQRDLAGALSVTQSYVSEIENAGEDSSRISVRQAIRFASALKVQPAALIDDLDYQHALARVARPVATDA